jgi:hypothetical protein
VQLYLNLATDQTFLFRDGQVSIEARVDRDDLTEVMAEIEEVARKDTHFIPRYSELAYIPRHFSDLLQTSLPCTESQVKLMVHSTGEVGGCWAHSGAHNIRETSIAEILASDHYRDQHEKFFRKECKGCGSNYALNLSWRPRSYFDDLMWRLHRRSLASPPVQKAAA